MTPRQVVDVALIALLGLVLALAIRTRARQPDLRPVVRWVALVAGAALITVLVRMAVVRPGFLHSNFHGYGLLDSIARFPAPPTHRSEYGNVSFLVLGAAWKLGGERWEAVTTANQVFAAASLALFGWVAGRWTGRARTALFVFAAGALHPALARVAASEDAHVVAVFFGCVALLAFDVYATSRARSMLVAGTLATLLMLDSRQTMYAWAPSLLIVTAGRGAGIARTREFRTAAAIVLVATGARAIETTLHSSDRVSLIMSPIILSAPGALIALIRHHPLFDVTRMAALTLPVFVIGLGWLVRRSGAGKGLGVLLFAMLVLTLPMGFPTPGVELSFRLPLMLPAIGVAGIGADVLVARFADAWSKPANFAVATAAGALLAVSPLMLPGRALLSRVSPESIEYAFLRSAGKSLPPGAIVAALEPRDPAPAYAFPRAALREAGSDARVVPMSEIGREPSGPSRVLFYVGLNCRGYSLGELMGVGDLHGTIPREKIARGLAALIEGKIEVAVPSTLRPECEAILARSMPTSAPALTLESVVSDVPFVVYGSAPITLRFVELRSLQFHPSSR